MTGNCWEEREMSKCERLAYKKCSVYTNKLSVQPIQISVDFTYSQQKDRLDGLNIFSQ